MTACPVPSSPLAATPTPSTRRRCAVGPLAVVAVALALLTAAVACGGSSGATTTTSGGSTSSEVVAPAEVVATLSRPGEANYLLHCSSCHGVSGQGQPNWIIPGPDGVLPAPPHDDRGHSWHHGDGYLFLVTKRGGAALSLPGAPSGMPAFDALLTDQEIREVVDYIKNFWGPDQREYQSSASQGDPFPR